MPIITKRVRGRLKWVKIICDHCGTKYSSGSVQSISRCCHAARNRGWDVSRQGPTTFPFNWSEATRELTYCPDCVVKYEILPSSDGTINDTEPPIEDADIEAIKAVMAETEATEQYGEIAKTPMPFGKFKGKPLASIRGDYLMWLLSLPDIHRDLREKVIAVLKYRGDRVAR